MPTRNFGIPNGSAGTFYSRSYKYCSLLHFRLKAGARLDRPVTMTEIPARVSIDVAWAISDHAAAYSGIRTHFPEIPAKAGDPVRRGVSDWVQSQFQICEYWIPSFAGISAEGEVIPSDPMPT